MSKADYVQGLVWFALTTGPVVAAATLIVRRRLKHLSPSQRAAGWGLLFTAGTLADGLIPGALGVLTRGTAALTAISIAAATWLLVRRAPPARNPSRRDELRDEAADAAAGSGPVSWALAAAAFVCAAVYVTAFLIDRRGVPITAIDALTFGLPTVDRWIQDGSVWSVGHYAVGWAFGAYPNNGEVVQLGAMLPWHSDAFVRLVGFPYVVFSGMAVYALARELRAPRSAATAWACASVAIPASLLAALEYQKTDIVMLACFVSGGAFLLRHARSGASSDLLLAGLGLGLAFGSRWYGVSGAAAVVAIWIGARILGREHWRQVFRDALLLVGLVVGAGGLWLLRNWVQVGDPFFPVKVAPLGITVFDAPPDVIRARGGFSLLHYASDGHAWKTYLWPALRNGFALPGGVAMVASLVALPGLRRVRDLRLALVGVAALVLGAIYLVTPYTAQGPEGRPVQAFVNVRYGVPAAALGVAVAAALGARGRRWAIGSAAIGLLATLDGLLHVDNAGLAPWLQHVARPSRVAEALAALGAAAALVALLRRRRLRRFALVATAVAAVVVGYVHERGYTRVGYFGYDPALDAVLKHNGPPLWIGVTGTSSPNRLSPVHPLIGPRLRNHVRLLGPVVRHTLQPLTTRTQLIASLHGRYQLVYVMRPRAGARVPQEAWLVSLGYRPVAQGASVTLFSRATDAPALP